MRKPALNSVPPDLRYASALLIVADTPAAAARAAAAARTADLDVAATLPVVEATAQLADGAVPGLVLVELDATVGDTDALTALLRQLDGAASRYASIVSTPAVLIDSVAALTPHARIVQLADATPADRVDALDLARQPLSAGVRETGAVGLPASATPPADDPKQDAELATRIRAVLRTRRLRSRYFDPALFADPAWDMLLDLAAARLARQRVAVSSLCIAAAVPPTTALRWIKTLTDCGLFVRVADPTDGRRVFIDLSEDAADRVRAYFTDVGA